MMSKNLLILAISFFLIHTAYCQDKPDTSGRIILVPGPQYNKPTFYQKLWGSHYRKEWITPVSVPYIDLDTTAGGLTVVRKGGGRQTSTLHLTGKNGKPYVLRSVDKKFGAALPDIYKGSFIENLMNDQVSTEYPYAAVTITPIISATSIYHTNPRLVVIPRSDRLGTYKEEFSGMLAIFEERPDENQSDAAHFGYSKNVIGTERMMEKIFNDPLTKVDQVSFLRARLFDMFIGDWGRHDDQWRWAEFKEDGLKIYKAIPRDRDQAYTKFDGFLLSKALSVAGLSHLKSFGPTVRHIDRFNWPARHLDHLLLNETNLDQWLTIAKELQLQLTDSVIDDGIKRIPPEVYNISGPHIANSLKARRNSLKDYATEYYHFLSEEVNIPGTNEKDVFSIKSLPSGEVDVKRITTEGRIAYHRIFKPSETKEIRLYGLEKDDVFQPELSANSPIELRFIGGYGNDSIASNSDVQTKVRAYDDDISGMKVTGIKAIEAEDSLRGHYKFDSYVYDKKGIKFKLGTTVGIGYRIRNQHWGKAPFGVEHSLMAFYTISRQGKALQYQALIRQWPGRWHTNLTLRADIPFVDHYFGLGNETIRDFDRNRFYRLRSTEFLAGITVHRDIDSLHFFGIRPFAQSVRVRYDTGRFVSSGKMGLVSSDTARKYFGGSDVFYRFIKTNNEIAPSKGFGVNAGASYVHNLENTNSFTRYGGSLHTYLPLARTLTFAIRVGAASLDGKPEFYQYNTLGGNENLRGFARRRFFAKTVAFNNNELRWLKPVRSKVLNGRIGILAFADAGRGWQPGETSNTWHLGYGGGPIIEAFDNVLLNGTIGFSKEDMVIHFRVGFLF